MDVGALRHLVVLENPGAEVPDGDGGYTQVWTPLSPAQVWASIMPATARDLERQVASTVRSTTSHVIHLRYINGVNTSTRIRKGPLNANGTVPSGTRIFNVTGIQNVEERDIELRIAAEEMVA